MPAHFPLLSGLGASLACEGALSGAYHLCPSRLSFPFDSSFMLVTAALTVAHLYQNRHADVNARAHHVFSFLALVFALGAYTHNCNLLAS